MTGYSLNQTHHEGASGALASTDLCAAEATPQTGFLILFSFQRPRAT
jgi:hypothetical protein